MVFGIFFDVPLLTGTFVLMVYFRKQLTTTIAKLRLPPLALYLLLSVPLIIFEEQIDCQPSWCGSVAIPPTLPFLLVEMLLLGVIVLWRRVKNLTRVTLVYSIFGVSFELFLGGLVGAPAVVVVLLAPYVALGYAFISMLPVSVLIERRRQGQGELPSPNTSSPVPSAPNLTT
jgi:hypothetical protein